MSTSLALRDVVPGIRFPRLLWVVCLCFACASTSSEAHRSGAPELTVDRILALPSITGTAPSSPVWSPDSERLAFLWNDHGLPQREVWLVQADGSDLRQLTEPLATRAPVSECAWLPDGHSLVFVRSGALWRRALAGEAERLTEEVSATDLSVSPDGRFVSFLSGGDLWLFERETRMLRRATQVGVPSISKVPRGRYNRPDVEIGPYVWGSPTYAWSPDSRTIAVHHVDRREMRRVPFPDYLGAETDPNFVRRGYPGDPNERRTVGLLDVEDGDLTFLDLSDPASTRVAGFSWSSTGKLLVDRESDTAVDRWLHVYDPATGALRDVWHDRRTTRIYTATASAWHPDGEHVIFLGDIEERYGLYRWGAKLEEPQRLSQERFDVLGGLHIAAATGEAFYLSNDPSPYEQHVFRTSLNGGTPQRVTRRAGHHRAYPSPDGTRVALLHSSDQAPTELYLTAANGRQPERRITRSPGAEFEQRKWARARYVTLPSHVDDVTLHARILEPASLTPGRRYPVLLGPAYSNTARNRWTGRYGLLQQLLVDRGYIVVQVDMRGSTGYGRTFREGFLMDFAGKDLDDLESAVRYLKAQPHVDPERFGIWGSSYGGTLTLYSLLKKPGLFRAGVACAAAVDPYFFGTDDVAIVRRPQTHPQAFERGAAQYAANLEDHLLIIHGMQDHVVPFKTTVALAEELIRQGKDFDFAFGPSATHAWTSDRRAARYLLGKLVGHFDRYLMDARP